MGTLTPADALMGKRQSTPDFKRSNRIHRVNFNPSAEELSLSKKLIETARAGAREAYGQKLLNNLCAQLRAAPVRLHVHAVNQPHKKTGGRIAYKEYGAYYLDEEVIRISNLTAVRGQIVAGKSFFDTLIHEFMHHLDRKLLGIPSTPHSRGFYHRVDDLKRKLIGGTPQISTGKNHCNGQWESPPKGLLAAVEHAAREAGLKFGTFGTAVGHTPNTRTPRTSARVQRSLFSTKDGLRENATSTEASPAPASGQRNRGKDETYKGATPCRDPSVSSEESQLALDFDD